MAGVDYFRQMDRKVTKAEVARLLEKFRELADLPLAIDDTSTQTAERIRREVERYEPDILIVDYLQYVAPHDPKAPRVQQVGQISRDLTAIKGDYRIPVVIAAQLNRDAKANGNREPQLHDLRDSGEIEQDADVVMFLHAEAPEHKETEGVRLLCRKNRAGKLFNTALYFEEGQQWFNDAKKRKITA